MHSEEQQTAREGASLGEAGYGWGLDTVFMCDFIVDTSLVHLLESDFRNGISLVLEGLVLGN